MAQALLAIGEVAERTGLAVSAIRFYEEKGLVKPIRNAGGQRQFLRADIRRLSFVMVAQQFGFTIGGPIVRDKAFLFVSYDQQEFNSTKQFDRFAFDPSESQIHVIGSPSVPA